MVPSHLFHDVNIFYHQEILKVVMLSMAALEFSNENLKEELL